MLVLSRQKDETIIIGDDIEITVVDIRGDKVRLGVSAPKEISVHRKEVYDAIRRENREAAQVKPEDLPNNTYDGDGSPMEPEVLDALRAAYCAETVAFPWQEGDILMLDNMLAAHGRAPFTGPRRILVAMAEPSRP